MKSPFCHTIFNFGRLAHVYINLISIECARAVTIFYTFLIRFDCDEVDIFNFNNTLHITKKIIQLDVELNMYKDENTKYL